jgi:hypothetical protein
MTWIQTHSGRKFDFLSPSYESICIEDIAHSLSMQCRFTGHTSRRYSVAAHSILVASLVPTPLRLEALLHDASEAYLGDVSTPLKQLITEYQWLEERIQKMILIRYAGVSVLDRTVKDADRLAMRIEATHLLGIPVGSWFDPVESPELPTPPVFLDPYVESLEFLRLFNLYSQERAAT